ncbi:MAG: cupredoxin domain-containing protein [Actinomycetota bacterium]|jgi:plastocyanin
MRKWILSIIALVAVLGPATGVVWFETQPSQAAESKVTVNDEQFSPADVTVPTGSMVTFENTSQNAPHSAKAADGSFDTGYIMPGASAQVTMSKAGEFQYFCEPHPWKKGVIKVQ